MTKGQRMRKRFGELAVGPRDCWRSDGITGKCAVCGEKATHSPLRLPGLYCDAHCTVCTAFQKGSMDSPSDTIAAKGI
jgi:hypothetical protein